MRRNREIRIHSDTIHEQAVHTLFELLSNSSQGGIAVDKDSKVAWINEKYVSLLGLKRQRNRRNHSQ